MTTDFKTSVLVEQQVPEFVREEFPQFVKFLKAYYEFLEQKQGIEKNDLISFSKKLRSVKDVDESLEDFETNFYNMFGILIPYEVQCNKELLFKHLANLYRSKGSEDSFKLLFHLLFGEDVDVILPKNDLFKPSESKWTVDSKLNINTTVYSYYEIESSQTVFDLTQEVNFDEISVYVNDVILTHGTDFYVQRENLKLILNTSPSVGSNVKVFYENFDYKLFVNRRVVGLTSGASAIIEDSNRRSLSDSFNLGLPIELLINAKSLERNFFNGETVSIPIFNKNEVLIETRVTTFAVVKKLNIAAAGQNYKVGDRVTLISGNPTVNAIGEVDVVYEGVVDTILVADGGATFTNAAPLLITGNGTSFYLEGAVDGIDLSGRNAANVWYISTDKVETFNGNTSAANTRIDAAAYGFAANTTATMEARIIDALLTEAIPMGPISNVKILLTSAPLTATPEINVEGGYYSTDRTAKNFGSIAKFKINTGGSGYKVGDEIYFNPIPFSDQYPMAKHAYGAAAVVGNVSVSGAITRVDVANTRIDGNVKVTSIGSTQVQEDYVVGPEVRTKFTTQLKPGDVVDINGESRIVDTITSDQIFSVQPPGFTYLHSKKRVGVYNRNPRGGYGYMPGLFPTLNVTTNSAGTGANISIYSIASDGENLDATGFGIPGSILSIKLVDPGAGYQFVPTANIVSTTGTGGFAAAEIERSFTSGVGRWTTSDSIASSIERRLPGSDYYVDYSYLLSSKVEFYKYKKILRELLHPVGFVKYANYSKSTVVERDDIIVTRMDHRQDDQFLTISGTVNTGNGSIAVTGINTKFNIAVSSGILSVGSQIAVNGEIRTVNAIISNTRLITSGNVNNIYFTGPFNTPTGNGMSNGYIIFSGGGGRVTSLTVSNPGSGYANGILEFLGADEGIRAVANAEIWPAGDTGVISITANTNAKAVNSWITFTGNVVAYAANARVYVDGTGNILNVTVANTGHYTTANGYYPTIANVYTSLTYYENTTPLAGSTYTNAVFSIVSAKTGTIRRVTLTSGGLYSQSPRIVPSFDPHYVYYANTFTIAVRGEGYSNGNLTILGGDSFRSGNASIEVYPPRTQINSISNNASSIAVNSWIVLNGTYDTSENALNARVFVNTTGHVLNVTIYQRGLYSGLPANIYSGNIAITSANLRYYENGSVMTATSNNQINAIFTISTTSLGTNGSIRSISVIDSGLYDGNASIIYPNTNQNLVIYQANVRSERSVLRVSSNVGGVGVNGYLRFAGSASNDAVATTTVNATGYVVATIVYANGVYTSDPTIVPDLGVVSVTANAGAVGVNSWITFDGTVSTLANTSSIANARVYVNTAGYIENVTIISNGAYSLGPSLSNVYTGLRYFDSTSANGSNGATLADSVYTNAVFTITTTNASYQVQFTKNEGLGHSNGKLLFNDVYVDSVSVNSGAIGVNSWITFYTTIDDPAYTTSNVLVANARVFVNSQRYIVNVTVYSNGTYFAAPTIGANGNVYTGLTYYENTAPIAKSSYTNAVFTINTSRLTSRPADVRVEVNPANGSIRKLTIVDPGLYANTVRISNVAFNTGAVAVNSWINFSGVSSNAANARVFVYPNGAIQNVTIRANGFYQSKPTIGNVYTDLIYYENTTPISTYSYSNAVFTILSYYVPTTNGVSPLRAIVNTQPLSVTAISPNVSAPTGTIRTYNGASHTNGFVRFSGGNPIREANASVEVYPSNGSIKSVTINDVGLYSNIVGLTASVSSNSTPNSITQVLPNVDDFPGMNYSNGFLKIVGGGANTAANVQVEANSVTGKIVRTVINRIGLYANISNVSLYPGVESISFNSGAKAVNSWITFSGGAPDATGNIANARVYVNTKGFVVNVRVFANGIYAVPPTSQIGSNGANIYTNLTYYENTTAIATGSYTNAVFTIAMGPVIFYQANGLVANANIDASHLIESNAGIWIGNTGARFSLGYNANTTNLANLVITTTANTANSANVSFFANSNAITNAVITVAGVANSQTIAVINSDFIETNVSAQATFQVWSDYGIGVDRIDFRPNKNVFTISANSGAVAVNSWIVFGGANSSQANARVFVDDKNRIENVTVYTNGSYSSGPIISQLVHYANNQPLVSQAYVNAVFVLTAANVPNPRAVNSWIIFATNTDIAGRYLGPANGTIQAANARVFVYPNGAVQNVTVYANGSLYGNTITANTANLRYYENNAVFVANTNSQINVVFTVVSKEIGNGVIRSFQVTNDGSYYWRPTMTTNTSYIVPPTFIANAGMFRSTTNTAPAMIIQTSSGIITEGFDEIITETGDTITTETVQPLG